MLWITIRRGGECYSHPTDEADTYPDERSHKFQTMSLLTFVYNYNIGLKTQWNCSLV